MADLTPRDSTQIAASKYDANTRELHIQFRNRNGGVGGTWIYHDVPSDVADKFHSSESLGTVFMREIRDRFRTTVHTPPPKPHIRLKPTRGR